MTCIEKNYKNMINADKYTDFMINAEKYTDFKYKFHNIFNYYEEAKFI